MNASEIYLFSQRRLYDVLQAHLISAKDRVFSISKEQFLANDDEQVASHVFSKMEIVPLAIYRDRAVMSEPRETRLKREDRHLGEVFNVDGVEVELSIPYSGESDLWVCRPSSDDYNHPRGSISPSRGNDQAGIVKVKLVYTQNEFQSENVNREIDNVFHSIGKYTDWIKKDIEAHNPQLKAEITRLVRQRREQLGAIHNTLKTLNIPIARRDGAPDMTELPVQRKVIEPLPSKTQSQPEYGISDSIYDHVLSVIRHEGISFERTPITFAKHDEEELRDILLAHLNSYFKGQATGETFRKKGKTDICIEFENRAAFVAECKLWKGRKEILEAIDQLLGYLTWRDVKAAIVIFNKGVSNFSQIQEKVLGILREHPNCVSAEYLPEESEWRMTLRSKEDPERFIVVRIFLFNLYTS